jgi:hypothetical protein
MCNVCVSTVMGCVEFSANVLMCAIRDVDAPEYSYYFSYNTFVIEPPLVGVPYIIIVNYIVYSINIQPHCRRTSY